MYSNEKVPVEEKLLKDTKNVHSFKRMMAQFSRLSFAYLHLKNYAIAWKKKVNKTQITIIYVEKAVTSLIWNYFYYCYIGKKFFLLKLNKLGTCVDNFYSIPTTLFYVDFLYLMDHYYYRHVPPWEGHKCKATYAK